MVRSGKTEEETGCRPLLLIDNAMVPKRPLFTRQVRGGGRGRDKDIFFF